MQEREIEEIELQEGERVSALIRTQMKEVTSSDSPMVRRFSKKIPAEYGSSEAESAATLIRRRNVGNDDTTGPLQ